MDTIKELYYGNIHPYEREIKKDSEIDRLAKLVLKHDTELRKTLNESETELFGRNRALRQAQGRVGRTERSE